MCVNCSIVSDSFRSSVMVITMCLGGRRKGEGQKSSLGKKQQLQILAERGRYLVTCVV